MLDKAIYQQFKKFDYQASVWRVTASVLLQEHINWETRNKNEDNCTIKSPTVSTRDILFAVKKGYCPTLCIDEIDKIVPTDFKLGRLCEIVDAIYANGGQVIATSNKSVPELVAKWGSDEAGTILRRIAGERGHALELA